MSLPVVSPARFIPTAHRKVTVTDQIGQALFAGALVAYAVTKREGVALCTGKVLSYGPTALRISVLNETGGRTRIVTKAPWECVRYGEAT